MFSLLHYHLKRERSELEFLENMIVKLDRYEKNMLRRLQERENRQRQRRQEQNLPIFVSAVDWVVESIGFEFFLNWLDHMTARNGWIHTTIILRLYATSRDNSDDFWYVFIAHFVLF